MLNYRGRHDPLQFISDTQANCIDEANDEQKMRATVTSNVYRAGRTSVFGLCQKRTSMKCSAEGADVES